MLPLTLDGVSERQARQRANGLLQQVGLVHRAAHFPAQLSGGEMQRVAVARAVAAEPDLLLADEPTGNLDSQNGCRVMQLLSDLNQRLDITLLLATHSDEAASYASTSLYLNDGRLLSPQEEDERVSQAV
jgi:ABC-type lipoprotein export system ATPase subunit